jgi:hypothetical protein
MLSSAISELGEFILRILARGGLRVFGQRWPELARFLLVVGALICVVLFVRSLVLKARTVTPSNSQFSGDQATSVPSGAVPDQPWAPLAMYGSSEPYGAISESPAETHPGDHLVNHYLENPVTTWGVAPVERSGTQNYQSSPLAHVEYCDLGSDGRWLLSETMNTYSYDANKYFRTSDEDFMKSNFLALIMTNPDHSALLAQSSRCARAFRSAIERHLRTFPKVGYSAMRSLNKSGGKAAMDSYVYNAQRVRLHTGAVIPVVFAQAIDSFMKSENPAGLTGVIQMAMSVIPDSGELHPWRPKA